MNIIEDMYNVKMTVASVCLVILLHIANWS